MEQLEDRVEYSEGTLLSVDRVVEFQEWRPHSGGCAYEYHDLKPGTPILILGPRDDISWNFMAVVGEMKGAVMSRDITPRRVVVLKR